MPSCLLLHLTHSIECRENLRSSAHGILLASAWQTEKEPWTELTAGGCMYGQQKSSCTWACGQHAVQEGQFSPACLVPKTPKAALLPSHSSGLSHDFKGDQCGSASDLWPSFVTELPTLGPPPSFPDLGSPRALLDTLLPRAALALPLDPHSSLSGRANTWGAEDKHPRGGRQAPGGRRTAGVWLPWPVLCLLWDLPLASSAAPETPSSPYTLDSLAGGSSARSYSLRQRSSTEISLNPISVLQCIRLLLLLVSCGYLLRMFSTYCQYKVWVNKQREKGLIFLVKMDPLSTVFLHHCLSPFFTPPVII